MCYVAWGVQRSKTLARVAHGLVIQRDNSHTLRKHGAKGLSDISLFFFFGHSTSRPFLGFLPWAVPPCGRAFLSPRTSYGNSHVPSRPEIVLGPPTAPAWDFKSEWKERKIQGPVRNVCKVAASLRGSQCLPVYAYFLVGLFGVFFPS